MTTAVPMALLPVWDFLQDDLGVGASALDPVVLRTKLITASELIETKVGRRFRYRTIRRERHRWRGDWLSLTLFNRTIRTLTGLFVISGVTRGSKAGVTLQVTPTNPTDGPWELPDEFGDVTVNRTESKVEGVSLAAILGSVPLVALADPWVEVSYTCGYDDGDDGAYGTNPSALHVTAPDGYVWPVPWHLRQACRIVAADLINSDWDSKRGMGKLLSLKVGNNEYRRMPVRPHVDYSIPSTALQLIQREWNAWVS